MKKTLRRLASAVSAGGLLYVAGSWAASRALAERLLSSRGLGPTLRGFLFANQVAARLVDPSRAR